ncbi:MAG: S41 family peptidase [Cyanobacteria bacterium P01_A01_bin.45]
MKQSETSYPKLQIALIGGIIATTTTFSFAIARCHSVKAALQNSPKATVDQVWQLVYHNYVDYSFNKQDWQALRRDLLNKNYSSTEEAYRAINKLLGSLGDPYTRFLKPEEYKSLIAQTSGEISGIGVRMEFDDASKRLIVTEVLENSPAIKAGIKKGDEILAINGKATREMNLEKASNLVRGKAGTVITLQVVRPGEKYFNVKLTRGNIEIPKVDYTLRQEGSRNIGYIRLREFSANSAKQMQTAIADLEAQKVDGFVLDLRSNPGGVFEASIEIAKMWLNEGDIVRTEYRKEGSKISKANGTALTNKPLAILVDGNSASASEILTGALQDNQRAVVIGDTTFGKALVQLVRKLDDGSGVAITTAHYYTPKGTDINEKGISPDINLYLTNSQKRQLARNPKLLGTRKDPYYNRALKAL